MTDAKSEIKNIFWKAEKVDLFMNIPQKLNIMYARTIFW